MRKFFVVATEVTGALICVAGFRKGREREFWARPLVRLRASLAPGIPFPLLSNACHAGYWSSISCRKIWKLGNEQWEYVLMITFTLSYLGRLSLVRLFCGRCHPESVLIMMEYCNSPCNLRNHIHVFNHHPKKKLFPLTTQVNIAQTISTKHS